MDDNMHRTILYGIIAAVVVAAGVGIGVAIWSMNGNSIEPAVAGPQSSDNDVRVIKHAMGETEITGTPERVVVLVSYFAEPFLILDIEPLGLAGLEQTRSTWYPEISSWTGTVDVGASNEPNLETIAQLEPDLIIGSHNLHSGMYEQLDDIAPTLLFHQRPANYAEGEAGRNLSALENMEQNFMAIADALNHHDDGAAALEGMHAKFDDAESRLEAAGIKGEKVIQVMIWGFEGDSFIRVLAGDKSLTDQVVEEIGLENAVTSSSFEDEETKKEIEDWGELVIGLEGLAALDTPGAHLLIIESINFDAAMRNFEGNPVWNNLSFVKEGRVYTLGAVDAVGAGPIKLPEFANKIVDKMTAASK
jgi:ABC-type Fe3+-citrate transport system substrate-binding protein